MAGKIRGITIEIGGDTSKLQKSLKEVDSALKSTQSQLKDVNKLLKLDPKNTELLKQKQQLLKQAVEQTNERLKTLKQLQGEMDANGIDKNSAQYQALQREIIETEKALKAATKEANGFHPALERIKAGAEQAASKLGEAAQKTKALSTAAGAALAAIGGMGMKALQTADDVLTLSRNSGVSTRQLQKFAYASDRLDVSTESMVKALTKLKTKIDPNNEALAKLGVVTNNADGSLRNANDVFYDVLEALSKVKNETERDQMAMELFGKSADELSGIIDDGGAALREYGEEAEQVGAVMDEETLTSLGAMQDQIDKLKAQGMATLIKTGAKALQALSPVLEKVAEAIGKVLTWIGSLSPETLKIIMIILAVIAAISPLLSILSTLATAIAFLASPIGIAIAAITAIIAIGVLLYKNWDTIKEKAADFANRVKTSWNNLKTGIVNTATAIWNRVKLTFSRIATAVMDPFNRAKAAVERAVETIKGLFPLKLGKIFEGIQLPHFKISGGKIPWGVGGQGEKPSIDIKWYRRAMNQPYVLDGATIFGAMGGKLLGGGEAGKEVILSYDKLQRMAGTENVVINVYPSAGMNETALANKIQRVFVRQSNQRRAARA